MENAFQKLCNMKSKTPHTVSACVYSLPRESTGPATTSNTILVKHKKVGVLFATVHTMILPNEVLFAPFPNQVQSVAKSFAIRTLHPSITRAKVTKYDKKEGYKY